MHQLLDPAFPLNEVFDVVESQWRAHQLSEFEICLGIRRLYRDHFDRGNTYSRFSTFLEREIGIPEKLAWTFSALGQHFERLPLLADAVARGDLTYTKAREFARWIAPEDQAEWIEYAMTHTNREIERHVAKYKAVKQGREYEEKQKVTVNLTATESQALRAKRPLPRLRLRPGPVESVVPRGTTAPERRSAPRRPRIAVSGHRVGPQSGVAQPSLDGPGGEAASTPGRVDARRSNQWAATV